MHILIVGDMMKFSLLKQKQVVLLKNGEVIGYIVDCIIDPCNHQIQAYLIKGKMPCYKRCCSFLFPAKVYEIAIDEIKQIGTDLIFVS